MRNQRSVTGRSMGWVLAGLLVGLGLLTSGCRYFERATTGAMQTETSSIDAGGAESAAVDIELSAGELTIGGGAEHLLDAAFEYNADQWKPVVNYTVDGSQGTLRIRQGDQNLPMNGTVRNDWRINLGNDLPIDLKIEQHAGTGTLDLRGLDLTGLAFTMGAGNAEIDLSEALDHDLHASIEGGIGNLSLKLPDAMGVQIAANTGLGELSSAGLVRNGDTYVNEAYGTAPATLFLDINAGIGSIALSTP